MTGRRLVVEADGGSRGNPGPAGYGALVRDVDTGELLDEVAESIGVATNNVAEYGGVLAGLRAAAAIDPDCTVEVRMDSKLVVEQMSGRWQIKHEDMRRLATQVRAVLPAGRVRYVWVPRAQNGHADRLANEAMDAAARGQRWQRRSTSSGFTSSGSTSSGSRSSVSVSSSSEPTRGSVRAPASADVGEPTTLLVARHGRTAATEQGRFSGRDGHDPSLSDLGEQDAARLAGLVGGLGRPGAALADVVAPSAVLASPMRRARETAGLVADRLGLSVDVDPGWVEAAFGAWEDLTYAEVAGRYPAELVAWQGSTEVAPPGGGERLTDVVSRVRAARRRLVEAHPGEVVVVVTHATPVRVLTQEALDAGDAALWRTRVTPAALTAVRYWQDGGIEVVTVNATGHLA